MDKIIFTYLWAKNVYLDHCDLVEDVDTVLRHWCLSHNYALSQSLHMYAYLSRRAIVRPESFTALNV